MKTNKFVYMAATGLALALFVSGCANYARLTLQPGEHATLQDLSENWNEYSVYYSGLAVDNLSGIMFDPKKDDKTLVPSHRWNKIEDKDSVSKAISWVKLHDVPSHYPTLYRILGPDGQFYGYLFTSYHHVYAKTVDERTLFVYDLPEPPYYYGGPDKKNNFGFGL